jgi:hypothetical protein
MKQFVKKSFSLILLLTVNTTYPFIISNNTREDFELSIGVRNYYASKLLVNKVSFPVGSSIDVSYSQTIIFPAEQLVVKLVARGFIQTEFVLTFPHIAGFSVKPDDELGVFPDKATFKIVRIGVPR